MARKRARAVAWSRGWAILVPREFEHPGPPGFIGYGYFGWQRHEHLSGYTTATFTTRKAALAGLEAAGMKGRTTVVPVTITITEGWKA